MNYPSEKTIAAAIQGKTVRPENTARLIRLAMVGPGTGYDRLEEIDRLLENYGIEYVEKGSNAKSPAFYYSNAGDTYDTTVLFFPASGRFSVGSWGNVVERGSYQ